jgi:glutaminase
MAQKIRFVDQIQERWEDSLEEWVTDYKAFGKEGQCASYIPALSNANVMDLGICLIGADGITMKSGEWEALFTMQSISKVISFIVACNYYGIPKVLEHVDVEPTGDAFNSIIRLEAHKPGKPFNPMINAGAITVSSLLPGETTDEKLESLITFMEKMIGKRPSINLEVFCSEWSTAYRNRALAYYLKETGFLETSVDESLEVYLKQCAMEVNTSDLARIGLILSYDGFDPIREEQIFSKEIARMTKALMLTCGMYNASGKFAAFVGIPAKSGVSGGILACVPPKGRRNSNQSPFLDGCGIGIYGPAIDEVGNSRAGVMLLRHIMNEWDLSIF